MPHTGFVKAVKVMAIAGAYWKGDESNKQLTRVYAITFPKKQELTAYLELLVQAKARDHRKLGKEMDLFPFFRKSGARLATLVAQRCGSPNAIGSFLEGGPAQIGV